MTGTSSARPADLQAYPGVLEPTEESLDSLAADLDTRMADFKSGAGEFATDFDAEAPGQAERELAAESRPLSAWVLSVGHAFDAAGGTGVVTVDNTQVSTPVGEPRTRPPERTDRK